MRAETEIKNPCINFLKKTSKIFLSFLADLIFAKKVFYLLAYFSRSDKKQIFIRRTRDKLKDTQIYNLISCPHITQFLADFAKKQKHF